MHNMDDCIQIDTMIPVVMSGKRLDHVLVSILPDYSRARLQSWIHDGYVKVDNKLVSPSTRIKGGEQLAICAIINAQIAVSAEDIPLEILFEDEYLLVINKPAGLVVHPGAGNREHTLMNALLYYDNQLEKIPRAGIVHRLDKNTTGILVIARTLMSHTYLVKQLQAHNIQRRYIALVTGVMVAGGKVVQAIGRDTKHRTKMAVRDNGRSATTHYRIIKKYRHHTQLQVDLETGRTHQIRVHMAWLRYPIIGDLMYGANRQLVTGMSAHLAKIINAFPRQALHARTLSLVHPHSKERVKWHAPMPLEINQLIHELEHDAQGDR